MAFENNLRQLRKALAIPLDEIYKQFESNTRQDIKIIIPEMLVSKLYNLLKEKGEDIKPEQTLEGRFWQHSEADEPNRICESCNFIDSDLPQYAQGPFALSFANEKAVQDIHYHLRHWEIYFSEKPLSAKFRYLEDARCRTLSLPQGGVIILGPQVVHQVTLSGMTLVLEVPSVAADKATSALECDAVAC